jgi:hypothetical protein
VSPVKYELGFYIPEDDILRSHCCESLKCYIARFVATCVFPRQKRFQFPLCYVILVTQEDSRALKQIRVGNFSGAQLKHFTN